jgi:Zinc carboxypeptidase.
MLIPMINPDGVANGHYRMDIYNQNLNRYYKTPDLKKQPAIFAIKELVTYLNSESRLFFYCDLHSHAAKKGCFFFGNHLDFVMQVLTQFFIC